jgi:Ca2+-binding EF-hand superfamily protein
MRAIFLAAIAVMAAAPVLAQQVTPEQAIGYVDKDGDGKCSLQEFLAFQVTRIAQFDANADGILQYAEFKESLPGDGRKNAQRSFDAFNTEGNAKGLTQREFLGYHAYVFKNYIDTDKDGFMSPAEWSKLMGQS